MSCGVERNLEPKTYNLEPRTVREPRPTTLITDYFIVRERPNLDESDSHKAQRPCAGALPVFGSICLFGLGSWD